MHNAIRVFAVVHNGRVMHTSAVRIANLHASSDGLVAHKRTSHIHWCRVTTVIGHLPTMEITWPLILQEAAMAQCNACMLMLLGVSQ
jgi:hypothetical protein